jgi:hypothetical protein
MHQSRTEPWKTPRFGQPACGLFSLIIKGPVGRGQVRQCVASLPHKSGVPSEARV